MEEAASKYADVRHGIINRGKLAYELERINFKRVLESTEAVNYFKNSFFTFALRHKEWADATFPDDTFTDVLKHLKEEIQEVEADPKNITEFADCFMLLIYAAGKSGFSMSSLLKAMWDKFKINKTRTWKNGRHEKANS